LAYINKFNFTQLKFPFFIFAFFVFGFCSAQVTYTLKLVSADPLWEGMDKQLNYKKKFYSEAEREKEIKNILPQLFKSGYLASRIDSLSKDSLSLMAHVTLGEKYKWARISAGNVDEEILSATGFRDKFFNNRPFSYQDYEKLNKKIILWCENNGYPFASIKLDSIEVKDNKTIAGTLNLKKDKLIKIDSIHFKGGLTIKPVLIYNYTGIKPGTLYNESTFRKVSTRFKELPYLKETKPAEILFTEETAVIYYYLDRKPANQFDGILGILPDNETPGKILFTGDVQLRLLNSLNGGELIDINWKKLQTQTQELQAMLNLPFIGSTPFGLEAMLDLYKRDTTFLNINNILGIQYHLSGHNYFKVFINSRSSSLLSSHGLEYLNTLPDFANTKTVLYGLGLKHEVYDYKFNPRKGFALNTNFSAGTRKINKHPKIDDILYENIELKSTQYYSNVLSAVFIPVATRATIKLANQSAFIISPANFENELYRIGGLRTLRGFDEESIFASSYSIFTWEVRYLLEQNSYAHIFWNGGWYEHNTINKYVRDTPWGFGVGTSFETKAGIFSINYALGKQFDNPIMLRTGKIHFGFVSIF
jgi:outer membrane protein assembly factor BamA